MRRLAACAAALLLAFALALPGFAAEPEAALGAELDPEAGLPETVVEQIGGYDGSVEGFGARLLRLLDATLGQVKELHLKQALASVGMLLAAALLTSVLENGGKAGGAVPFAAALTAFAACAGPMHSMLRLGTETVEDLDRYTGLLLPPLATLLIASGDPSAAAASGFTMGLLKLLLSLISEALVPLVWLFVLLSAAEDGFGMPNLAKLRDLLKWGLTTAVKALMSGYTAALGVTGVVTGSLDAQKLRSLRAVIAGLVPAVGNLVSEASGSLLAAAGVLKTGVGLYGMLAIFALCLGPFLQIGLQYLLLRLAAALCGLLGAKSLTALTEKLGQGMGLLLALTGVACLMPLMILVLWIRTVSP